MCGINYMNNEHDLQDYETIQDLYLCCDDEGYDFPSAVDETTDNHY